MIQYCEGMAKKYGLKDYTLPYEEIEKLPVYRSKKEFKDHHDEYQKIIDEVTEHCADIADIFIENYGEKLDKKEQYDVHEVLPFFTSLFSVTKYKWDE